MNERELRRGRSLDSPILQLAKGERFRRVHIGLWVGAEGEPRIFLIPRDTRGDRTDPVG